MKMYKPYLSLSKTAENYELDIVLSCRKDQTVYCIKQEEVKTGEKVYWGVIIMVSTDTQLVNGPENPVFSTTARIPHERSERYKTIKCIVHQDVEMGEYGPAKDQDSDIDFDDGGK